FGATVGVPTRLSLTVLWLASHRLAHRTLGRACPKGLPRKQHTPRDRSQRRKAIPGGPHCKLRSTQRAPLVYLIELFLFPKSSPPRTATAASRAILERLPPCASISATRS